MDMVWRLLPGGLTGTLLSEYACEQFWYVGVHCPARTSPGLLEQVGRGHVSAVPGLWNSGRQSSDRGCWRTCQNAAMMWAVPPGRANALRRPRELALGSKAAGPRTCHH